MNKEIVFDTSNRHRDKSMISYIKSLPCSFHYAHTGQIFFYSIIDRFRFPYILFTWADLCMKYESKRVGENQHKEGRWFGRCKPTSLRKRRRKSMNSKKQEVFPGKGEESKATKEVKAMKNDPKNRLAGKKIEAAWREFILVTDDKPKIVFESNVYEAGLWFDVFKQAGLLDDLQGAVIGCVRDGDGECAKRGCLHTHMIGYIFDVGRLLVVHGKVRKWLDKNSHYVNNMEEDEAKRRKWMSTEPCDKSDHYQAVRIMTAVVGVLRKLRAEGTEEIRYEDLGFTLECPSQCPRIMYLDTRDAEYTIDSYLVGYQCAKRLGYEELNRLMTLGLTAEEVKKMGVVLVESPKRRPLNSTKEEMIA